MGKGFLNHLADQGDARFDQTRRGVRISYLRNRSLRRSNQALRRRVEVLEQEYDAIQLYVVSLTRRLAEKGVISGEEITELIEIIEGEDEPDSPPERGPKAK